MDNVEGQNMNIEDRAVICASNKDISQKSATSLLRQVVDTATMASCREKCEQDNYQRNDVASDSNSLKRECSAASRLLLSSKHISNNNTLNVSKILQEADVPLVKQIVTAAKQQVHAQVDDAIIRPICADIGPTNLYNSASTKETPNSHYCDKNIVSKHKVSYFTLSLSKNTVKPTENHPLQESPTCPGAMAIFPAGYRTPGLSSPSNEVTLTNTEATCAQDPTLIVGASDVEASGEPTLKAFLVNNDTGVVASATLHDEDTERKKNQQFWMRTMLGSCIMASVIAIAVAVPVVLTSSGPAQASIGLPTSSPFPSAVPSFTPTSSPSTALFGFLVTNSFDGGSALDIPGSPQQMALDWLVKVSEISELDYHLLQNYALVTLFYETDGRQWISMKDFIEKRSELEAVILVDDNYFTGEWLNITPSVNPLGFCNWQGVLCNDNREIDSLSLASNRLKGSIPAELGILGKSLSKFDMKWTIKKGTLIISANGKEQLMTRHSFPQHILTLDLITIGFINFTRNSIEGTLPLSFLQMTNLGQYRISSLIW